MTEDEMPQADNGRRTKTLVYDEADAPMIAAAFRLGANVALCGESHGARERMKMYARQVKQNVPAAASHFNMEEVWTEIMIAIDSSPDFRVDWKRDAYRDTGTAEIIVGRRSWRTDMGSITQEGAEALGDALEMLAPITCERLRGPVETGT